MNAQVSVVIPLYMPAHLEFKWAQFTEKQLEAFEKYTDVSRIEVIYVCNGVLPQMQEKLLAWCDRVPLKVLWFEQALGFTKATNEGIRLAEGEHILLLNDDAFFLEEERNCWLNWLLRPFQLDSATGISGVHQLHCPHSDEDFIVGFCLMASKKLFQHIGLLDEAFSPGAGEDTDLCIRARLNGYKVVAVDSTGFAADGKPFMVGTFPIWHPGETSFHNWHALNDKKSGAWDAVFERNSQLLRQRKASGYYNKANFSAVTVPLLGQRLC